MLNACTALNLIQVFVNGKGLDLVIYKCVCKKVYLICMLIADTTKMDKKLL